MKRFIALSCEALARSLYSVSANSSNSISVQLLRQGLHDKPKNLRSALQTEIDAVDANAFEAILLAYGLCGTSIAGLRAGQIPIVIPRAHDCITIYLGSLERYALEFERHPGTYWFSAEYLERLEDGASDQLGAAGVSELTDQYEKYERKYGPERAQLLIREFKKWTQHYTRAVFIDTGLGDGDKFELIAKNRALQEGWIYERTRGDKRLLQMLVDGQWSEKEFLFVPPGHSIQPTYDSTVIRAVPDSDLQRITALKLD
jgi:hypothetical protein